VQDELAKRLVDGAVEAPRVGAAQAVMGDQLDHVGKVFVRSAQVAEAAGDLGFDQPVECENRKPVQLDHRSRIARIG
jgi:hypothetical protein